MIPLSAGNVSHVRSIGLVLSIIVVLFILLRSFNVGSQDISSTARQQLRVISHFAPWPSQAPRITKITSLFGEKDNDLYEQTIRSHEEHDRIHGYETRVFREKVVESYWSKHSLLLSVLTEELEKPQDQRTEWLMWISPDCMILNPQIPLEIFLPPSGFEQGHILATRDSDGVTNGVLFLQVHPSNVNMLIDVLTIPKGEFGGGQDGARRALEKILRSDAYRDHVLYQPRKWYNSYQISTDVSEAHPGDLLVHFHGMGGDKWGAMASTIAQTADLKRDWALPLEQTSYTKDVEDYWRRIREAKQLLYQAQGRKEEPQVDPPFRRLSYATTYEIDDVDAIRGAIGALREATGIR